MLNFIIGLVSSQKIEVSHEDTKATKKKLCVICGFVIASPQKFGKILGLSNFFCFVGVVLFCLLCATITSAQTPFSCANVTEIPTIECTTLVAFYNSTDGDNWSLSAKEGWMQTNTPCSWHGVLCVDGNVSELYKGHSNLQGAIPAEIGDLADLTRLDLRINALTSIPPEIGNLTLLTVLNLIGNELTMLPAEIGNMTDLTELSLVSNALTTLPAETLALTNLAIWGLTTDAGVCVNADVADVAGWRNITENNQLRSCFITSPSCELVTEIPMSECEALAALYNSTDGNNWSASAREGWTRTNTPCSWHGVVCTGNNVSELNKGFSNLSGTIPHRIRSLRYLTRLDLRTNNLTSIPPGISNLKRLRALHLQENELTTLPAGIGNLTDLTELNLVGNMLTTLPAEIGNLTGLTMLNLGYNDLSALPPEIGNLTHLTSLNLYDNALTTLPAEIGNLASLTDLFLYDNRLTTVPTELGNLSNLETLSLSGNRLTTLPAGMGNLTSLSKLYLSDNQLTSVPPEIGGMINLTELSLHNNGLTTLPPDIGNMTHLTVLSLQNNRLTMLPAEILSLTHLLSDAFIFDAAVCVDANVVNVEAWHNLIGITDPQHCSSLDNNTIESSSVPLSVAIKLEPIQAESDLMSMICLVLFLIGSYRTYKLMQKRASFRLAIKSVERNESPAQIISIGEN